MSEQSPQVTDEITERKFKERITAFIGVSVILAYGIVAILAAYAAIIGTANDQSFQQLKDLLTFLSGLVGTVVGYYFGRVGVEKRAEAAESMLQVGETVRREAERQAAEALARLDVEKLARDAAEKAKEFAETRMEQLDNTMAEITEGMYTVRERVEKFKQALRDADLGGLVLGAEGEGGPAPLPMDPSELDSLAADIDALLRKAQQATRQART